jgi:acetyltransferase-like isoleucine patch superfamily enzyme
MADNKVDQTPSQLKFKEVPFSELRSLLSIPDGYSDDNTLITDGDVSDLPKLAFVRHGSASKTVSGCRFEIPVSTRGAIRIIVAHSDSIVKVGQNTRMMLDLRLWNKPYIEIQEYTTINSARFVSDNSSIIVGRDCMFSDDILVQSSDQHGIWDIEDNKLLNGERRKIEIGEHVWVGRKVTIMPDTYIGDGSLLGTGAIVTKSVASCCIAVGVPAKTVRKSASWSRQPASQNEREKKFFARMKASNHLYRSPE